MCGSFSGQALARGSQLTRRLFQLARQTIENLKETGNGQIDLLLKLSNIQKNAELEYIETVILEIDRPVTQLEHSKTSKLLS